jgi:hypothetical protein
MWIAAAVALAVLVAGSLGAYMARPVSGETGTSEPAFDVSADSLSYLAPSQAREVNSPGYAAVVDALTRPRTSEATFAEISADNLSYLAASVDRDVRSPGYAVVVETLAEGALGKIGMHQTTFAEVSADSLFYLPASSAQGANSRGYAAWVAILTGQ